MLPKQLLLLCLTILEARAAKQSSGDLPSQSYSTLSSISTEAFTGSQFTYLTNTDQSTIDTSTATGSGSSNATATSSSSGSGSQSTHTTKHHSLTVVGAATPTGTSNGTTSTSSGTSSAARPSNTGLKCNGYSEFCNRQYSNITNVCAHNSAFSIPNNAASNQALGIIDQLDDGIRMIQGETHWVNDTIYSCHSTCELLNAGTWQSELETVTDWVRTHPYDVVTWLVVNSDFKLIEHYVPAIQASGIMEYLYEPEYVPQRRDQWPTLAEMILSGKRVVMFMDYQANQTAVPYVLDEFSHMWETPFSPTNRSFPCTQERPPNLNQTRARDEYMYLANHNLNTAVDVGALTGSSSSTPLLIPNTADINTTNGQYDEFSQLGLMSETCTGEWGRPPNFLLVDYYNYGVPTADPGAVFRVAAEANGVTYTGKCCGYGENAAPTTRGSVGALAAALMFAIYIAS